MLSSVSGRFVRVDNNGTITANGNQKSSAVFLMYLKNSQVQFELKSKPGMFLMLKGKNHSIVDDVNTTVSSPKNATANPISNEYTLVVDYPSEPFLTEWEKSGTCDALVQKVDESTTCSVAFDPSGNVVVPCHPPAAYIRSCLSVIRM